MPKEPYLRWHAAEADPTGMMRGANLESLNAKTIERIHEIALQENLNRLEDI